MIPLVPPNVCAALMRSREQRETQEWPRFVVTSPHVRGMTVHVAAGSEMRGFCVVDENGVLLGRCTVPTETFTRGGTYTVEFDRISAT